MIIAQITDCHITASGILAYGHVDPLPRLKAVIALLNRLSPRPDLVLATGDLTQNGAPEEYSALRSALETLAMPVFPLMGNHDRRDSFKAAFAPGLKDTGPDPFLQYAIDCKTFRILMLDTVGEGEGHGLFCSKRLAWVEEQVAATDTPLLIATHHPPFHTGIGWLDPSDPTWWTDLMHCLGQAPHVMQVISGHVHRAITTKQAGIICTTSAATAHQVHLDLAPGAPASLAMEPPGLSLHHVNAGQVTSFALTTQGFFDTRSMEHDG